WLSDPFGAHTERLRASPPRLSQPQPQPRPQAQTQASAHSQASASVPAAGAVDSKHSAAATAVTPADAPDATRERRASGGNPLGVWDPVGVARPCGSVAGSRAPANEWVRSVRGISMDVVERDGDFTVSADVPGMSKGDLKLTIDPLRRTLTIAGERRSHYE